jgi:tetratricopeptide (TPR) repeat protein
LGEFDAAIGDFTGAIEFDPNFAGAHHMRGLTYDDKGEYDRAIADNPAPLKLILNSRGATTAATLATAPKVTSIGRLPATRKPLSSSGVILFQVGKPAQDLPEARKSLDCGPVMSQRL